MRRLCCCSAFIGESCIRESCIVHWCLVDIRIVARIWMIYIQWMWTQFVWQLPTITSVSVKLTQTFAFQIAFPRGTDFAGFLQGGSKSRDLKSEISVRIESRIESAIVVYSFSVKFFSIAIEQMCGFVKTIARSLLGYYYCACSNYKYMN